VARVRAIVAYDGTDFAGFQRQTNAPTVQGALEQALATIGQPGRVLAAGRTDAGVHATGQVIAFDVDWPHPLEELQRALNAVLPEAIAIWEVAWAAPDFHPRFQARSRTYRYTLYNAPVRDPLRRRTAYHVAAPLDVGAMQEAARFLVGEHDFAAFGRPPKGENTVRRVLRAEWSAQRPLITFEIEATAFLYRMVRRIVGTLLPVGWGKVGPEHVAEVLASRDPSLAGPTVPPHGLCLVAVSYPETENSETRIPNARS